jgi:hypothetical protein
MGFFSDGGELSAVNAVIQFCGEIKWNKWRQYSFPLWSLYSLITKVLCLLLDTFVHHQIK